MEMQRAAGLTDVRWVDAAEAARLNPTLDASVPRRDLRTRDGCVDPPRNVRAVLARDAASRRRAPGADGVPRPRALIHAAT